MSFNREDKVRARKDHKCGWCDNPIKKGVVYIKQIGLFEGEFFTYKTHEKCFANIHEAHSLYANDCFDYECTYEYLKVRARDENPELLKEQGGCDE